MKTTRSLIILALLAALTSCTASSSFSPKRYTFTREFAPGSNLAPRGGTTKGTAVTPLKTDSAAWLALQKDGLDKQERDRRAILAMAGDYRASFEFIETIPFQIEYKLDRPYHSWATEKIIVLEDRKDFVSLQHIMVMFFVQDGETVGPMVIKHWRQDWSYQPRSFHAYAGENHWKLKKTTPAERAGAWVQEVFHVDDSPRYASLGTWEHNGSFSSWTGKRTPRPLPRREYSVRSDYQVLEGINRHVITPWGWIHEQENLKKVVSTENAPKYIAKELGHNRYDRIVDFDFSAGDSYWNKTQKYWSAVRSVWSETYKNKKSFRFTSKVDGKGLIWKHFGFAGKLSGKADNSDFGEIARGFIQPHLSD